jgi:hypothetical protein
MHSADLTRFAFNFITQDMCLYTARARGDGGRL